MTSGTASTLDSRPESRFEDRASFTIPPIPTSRWAPFCPLHGVVTLDSRTSTHEPLVPDDRHIEVSGSLPLRSSAIWAVAVLAPLALAVAISVFHNNADPAGTSANADSIAWPTARRGTAPASRDSRSVAPVGDLIAGLEQRLVQNPDDAKGWVLLAQSYQFLGNTERAKAAVARAVALGMDEADLRQRVVSTTSTGSNAVARASDGDVTAAVVRGVVDVSDDRLAPLLGQAGSRLFITAREPGGAPMPVAVLAADVAAYPFEYILSDANAMLPGTKLSDFEALAVSARLSQSGSAERSDGDLESDVAIVQLGANFPVRLTLRSH